MSEKGESAPTGSEPDTNAGPDKDDPLRRLTRIVPCSCIGNLAWYLVADRLAAPLQKY